MTRLSDLTYIYLTRKQQMDNKLLCELIDLLLVRHSELLETIDTISKDKQRLIDAIDKDNDDSIDNEDKEPEPHNYKEDLD